MRKPSRRSIATLIRVRQEIVKRLDATLPRSSGPRTLAQVLDSAFANGIDDTDDAARRKLAQRTSARFPLVHLRGRDVGALPAVADLRRSAAASLKGNWSIFGTSVVTDLSQHDWTAHPTTGARPSDAHWTRVSYLGGVGGGDVKAIWELNRHHHILRLAQGYFLDRSEETAESLVALIDQWIEQNPAGRGINWTSSLEVAFRSIAWCWIWALTCESPAWTKQRLERFLVTIWHHARHIERFDSIHHSPNTHLTGEGLGLLYIGLSFPELRRAHRWAERGREILESELGIQVFDDGVHFERAVGYHRYTAEFYLHYLLLADAHGLPVEPAHRTRIRAAVAATCALRRPDGSWPVIGDEDSGDTLLLTTNEPQDQGPILALGGALFREQSWVDLTRDVHRAAGWWLLDDGQWQSLQAMASKAESPRVTGGGTRTGLQERRRGTATALASAGYYVASDGSDDGWWCLVDAGPHGGDRTGHAHTDLGHVEISHGATLIIADPGCFAYTMEPALRDWARSELAHASLVIDDTPLALPSGPFSWSSVAPTPSCIHGDSDAAWWCELQYTRPHARGAITHRRQVTLVRGIGVVVCDWVDGDAPSSFALHWPLADTPDDSDIVGTRIKRDGYGVSWTSVGGGDLTAALLPIVRSAGYGQRQHGASLKLARTGNLPACVVSCFDERAGAFRVSAHERGGVRVDVDLDSSRDVDAAETSLMLHLMPGMAPVIERSRKPVISHGASR